MLGLTAELKCKSKNWLSIWFNQFSLEKNLKNNDNVKLLGEKMKGNIGLISGQITIYL